ncbi:carotenoid oxygenase [Dunaliella salina]|uniref:carotenoid 9,10-dioxygenase n=1 Tax=Dunaliella salina TaxID=3046 RepID=A0ABQ7G7E2_DUNSA|nr:carotenoid oxygenase [Dunaliella salina]|eukprot:KAF5830496.1 carotenoid oxygenase [Dunaliella salina]
MPDRDEILEAVMRHGRNIALPVSLALVVFSSRRKLINGLQTLIAKTRKEKNRAALMDNYGPVKTEVLEHNLPVKGTLPAELNGAYMRNGSNPYYDPYCSYHWFEGSGMVHAVRIKDGTATYCNRYVETSKLKQEKKAGKPVFAAFADQEGRRGVIIAMLELLKIKTGAVNVKEGTGTANTSLVYHAGRLLALHEGDLPYQLRMVCNGALETVQRLTLGKDWGETNFNAHPKFDEPTGQLHILGYNITKPEVKLGTMDPAGQLEHTIKVDLPWPSMMHDKAITSKYKIILHFPLCFDPQAMVKQDTLPIVWVKERPARIGLVPKQAKSMDEIKWFEMPR